MDTVITLTVDHSHLFPGAVLRLRSGQQLPASRAECLLLFSDDSTAEAEFVPGTDGGADARLHVSPYTTAAGTSIGMKTWALSPAGDGGLKVRRTDDHD